MADPDLKPTDDDNGICTACGLCCNGALFDRGRVLEGERDRLTAIGFGLVAGKDTDGHPESYWPSPCQMLIDTRCTVYADRPSKCAEFRCELLRAYDSGHTSRTEALDRIATAKSMLARVAKAIPAGWTFPEARRHWRVRLSGGVEPEADSLTAEFMMQMSLTAIFLDRYFYSERKRQFESLGE